MFNWIYNKLIQIKNKKQHDIIKLQWQKAELEKQLEELKSAKN